ncbi:MAG: anaerobic sulfatase-maturation protein [Puniceicoccaceae bacterium]|nr:MAG: anaerobic sulfatase-maturation protein [Puniceicoccaceae bacterium]
MAESPPNAALPVASRPFHVMTKPIGSLCNLDCKYCFYLEKEHLYPDKRNFRMSDEVLEAYIRQYIEQQPGPEVSFAWQGGEPTLLGVEFFEKVVALQSKYSGGKSISNALQTNGTLLDDDWGRFLRRHSFLVGLSVDGPRKLHDAYRVDKGQRPTFDKVMRGLGFLKKHQVDFNTLTVVHRENSKHPLEVYRFLKDIGSGFIQFIPLVERKAGVEEEKLGLWLAEPPDPEADAYSGTVTSWSVRPERYGEFLCTIFDEWVTRDVGRYFVQLFDVALGNWIGAGSGLCVFAETCGRAMAMEHNGDLYSCDHYVYPKYKLGNILNGTIGEMADGKRQRKFGDDKRDALPRYCRECEVRFACNGECPKHRFIETPDGEPGLNYLCAAYKRFFNHIDPSMQAMGQLLQRGMAPAMVMEMARERMAASRKGKRGEKKARR